MRTYTHYKQFKAQLSFIAPCFMYFGQYLAGKDNTSYKVPAIYIELPKNVPVTYFGSIKTIRKAQVKIHLITSAPFKNSETIQDGIISEHEAMLSLIDQVFNNKKFLKNGKLLTEKMIEVNSSTLNYIGTNIFSVITYQGDFFERD